jgi:hypothetical protein
VSFTNAAGSQNDLDGQSAAQMNPIRLVLHAMGATLANIENAPLELNALVLRHSFLRFDTVCAQVMAHYQNQAYRQGELFSS